MNKSGFTLSEILMAVLIMSVLVTMAVPMYKKAIEKSRVGEVGITLKNLNESKLRAMDTYHMDTFRQDHSFGLAQLDMRVPPNDEFAFRLFPASYVNSVCAVRSRGPNAGTKFLYIGEEAVDYCNCSQSYEAGSLCRAYCVDGRHFFCENAPGTTSCEAYSMPAFTIGNCLASSLN